MPSKAGRNRIYSVEERKDRNRTAQAAFRDRRNKYTQDLEKALVIFESKVKNLEESEKQLTVRAESAEERCTELESKVASLQKMIETIMADNLRLQSQCDTISSPNDSISLSPAFSFISDLSSTVITDPAITYVDPMPNNNTTATIPFEAADMLSCNNAATTNFDITDPTNYLIPVDSFFNLDLL